MDRLMLGAPAVLVLVYALAGWCVTIAEPELLIADVEHHVSRDWGRLRQYAGIFQVVLRRVVTWPRWWW